MERQERVGQQREQMRQLAQFLQMSWAVYVARDRSARHQILKSPLYNDLIQ